ncbi:hypothetical protein [Burkholderia gladioli]|uniref:hypothetical protein n=1 Tax=Burkholderia gladioli TaxID=28095 RepID=UPI00163E1DDE|nr:hypothetical protein [Burkholderia gladioli]
MGLAVFGTAILGGALLLSGCGDRSVSGVYVSHGGNQADLLQVIETPDHHLTGTLRHASLTSDGTLASSTNNVSGSVDGTNITLTVLATPLPIGQNFAGTATGGGIDLTVPNGAQTGVQHFAKGQTADFDAVVAQLNQAGQRIAAARQRGQRADQMNRQVGALADSLNRFVEDAKHHIDRLPRAKAYYDHAVTVEQTKLERAQRLQATGNGVAQGQAGVIVGQMGVDKAQIAIVDDELDRVRANAASAESGLNARIDQWRGTCLDGTAKAKAGDVIPDMGPCKRLTQAVSAYNTVLPALHKALASAVQARADDHARLTAIWTTASVMQ